MHPGRPSVKPPPLPARGVTRKGKKKKEKKCPSGGRQEAMSSQHLSAQRTRTTIILSRLLYKLKSKKLSAVCRKIWSFMRTSKVSRTLRQVLTSLKFVHKIKSKWKRYVICRERHSGSFPTLCHIALSPSLFSVQHIIGICHRGPRGTGSQKLG